MVQDRAEGLRPPSTPHDGRYKLCIGTFGPIPLDCELEGLEPHRLHGAGSVGPTAEFCGPSAASARRARRPTCACPSVPVW
jgi:hypothetical protein